MSTIESLGISGIRGYSCENYQRIQFIKPLTLIWGQNGSGKTTIIQCLKFITTGALPPNSDKGKSFIMDPKIAGKPEVIGDIRLIFKTGKRAILAKRRIQLSTKGSTTKFESIEQVLKTKGQNGQDLSINHQCAQIQKQVPQFLGISKPILENIVFCHQDESLWPFADSISLKKIFDELFQTKKVSKDMQRMWHVIKVQTAQVKQLKIRMEYEKSHFYKQMEQRQRQYGELNELKLQSRQFVRLKSEIKALKLELKDDSEKVQAREKLIHQRGSIQNSISQIKQKIRMWKERMYVAQKQFEQKIKGKRQRQFQGRQYDFSHRNPYLNTSSSSNRMPGNLQTINSEIQKVKMLVIIDPQATIQEIEFKESVLKQLITQYEQSNQQLEYLKNNNEQGKREAEITSEIQRVKSILPELKYIKTTQNNEGILRQLKAKLTDIENKIKGREICRQKLQKIEVPNFLQNDLNQKQAEQLKKQSKELQTEIQKTSIIILRIYGTQFKTIPQNITISEQTLRNGKNLQNELHNLQAIIKSKQQDLQHYEQLPTQKNTAELQDKINHYKYGGIQLQEQMLHFCQQKKKCYFCSKQMTAGEIQNSKCKVESIKKKAQQKLSQLQSKFERQNVNFDPQIMIKKLKQQLKRLQQKLKVLSIQVKKYQQAIKYQKQIKKNNCLHKELQKCKLSSDMTQKLSQFFHLDTNTAEYYENATLQEFLQLCSTYQINLGRYQTIKEQVRRFQNIQQKNELIKQKRQNAIKEKNELQQAINKCEDEIRNVNFIRNSCHKLQTLLKLDGKDKNNKIKKVTQGHNSKYQSAGKYSNVEQASQAVGQLFLQIQEQKISLARLQISLSYYENNALYVLQSQRYAQLIQQIGKLTKQLSTSKQVLNKYNEKCHFFEKEASRIKNRAQLLQKLLSQPFNPVYLLTLNKIQHLEASISNIQILYHQMQESISTYHASKMEEVNRYILELWREIYHGDDIQYIEIQAAPETDKIRRKKNYYYRIMMKKSTKTFNNQEMVEMKGRCSTGQKVLASIVIRLALAQVFCSNTRILALDEPTSNLDKMHIKNLALALLKLIEVSGDKGLQLIIISHDIEFIKLLEDYADSYYEVTRDQNRFSRIQKRQIKDIFSKDNALR